MPAMRGGQRALPDKAGRLSCGIFLGGRASGFLVY